MKSLLLTLLFFFLIYSHNVRISGKMLCDDSSPIVLASVQIEGEVDIIIWQRSVMFSFGISICERAKSIITRNNCNAQAEFAESCIKH